MTAVIFWRISHVFNIYSDETEVIERLTSLIRANQQSMAYAAAKAAWESRP
jgi:hypothetical protein